MRRIFLYGFALLGLILMAHPAEARKKHRHHHHSHRMHVASADPLQSFGEFFSDRAHTGMVEASPTSSTRPWTRSGGNVRYLPHPSGCPARLFCGCGAAKHIFGKPIRDLWLVANWAKKFPRAYASHGMAALRGRRGGGHIVVLDRRVSGSNWMVYDYNSGGHRSRYHEVNISGWTIVNPHAGRYAAL